MKRSVQNLYVFATNKEGTLSLGTFHFVNSPLFEFEPNFQFDLFCNSKISKLYFFFVTRTKNVTVMCKQLILLYNINLNVE